MVFPAGHRPNVTEKSYSIGQQLHQLRPVSVQSRTNFRNRFDHSHALAGGKGRQTPKLALQVRLLISA